MSSKKKAGAPAAKGAAAPPVDPSVPPPKPVLYLEFGVTAVPATRPGTEGGKSATGASRRQSSVSKEVLSAAVSNDEVGGVGDSGDAMDSSSRHRTFRLEFELQPELAPRTCDNFRQLAVGGATVGDKKSAKVVGYKGTRVLRATGSFIQAGDVLGRDDGKGQESIYGGLFDDEAIGAIAHAPGVLTMVNSGPNTNGSQFAIITGGADDVAYMNARHVAFGLLVGGGAALETLAELSAALSVGAGEHGEVPSALGWSIVDCGVAETRRSKAATPTGA
jgi:cyclophilin family peptidyl-prolyl cis-trans isomerase